MRTTKSLLLLLLTCISGYAQNTVSGYVNYSDPNIWERQVYLTQLRVHSEGRAEELVATAEIDKSGFFAFNESLFDQEDKMYQISVRRLSDVRSPNELSERNSASFIISQKDSLYFPKGVELFSDYISTSMANKEWQKLKKHEATSETGIRSGTEQYLKSKRDYTKDSLQILLVKLLSIQTLENQKLLQKDVRENADYYLGFLSKLQQSELPPASYAYLERRIQETHQELLLRRYYTSLAFNGLLLVAIGGLLFMLFRRRKNKFTPKVALSKQEENVKALILDGKTNKEIAGALFISISTVKTHISNIYSKMDVSNRKELMHKS